MNSIGIDITSGELSKLTHCIGKVFTSVVNIATILIDIKITTDGLMEYTLENCQKIVDEWVNSVGVRYFSELTNTAILMEEVGELARIMARRFGDQSFKDNEEDLNLADEIADILFVLICLANQTGVQLEDAFRQSILKKTDRDRDRHANNPKLFSDSGAKE